MRRVTSLLSAAFTLLSLRAQAPEAVLPLEAYRKTLAIHATVEGKEGFFVLDTAGGLSLISPAFAGKLGRKPWGRITGFQMMGDRLDTPHVDGLEFRTGSLRLKAATVGVLDIMTLYPKDAAPVDGSLALDLFDGRAITLDFAARKLIVESPESLKARIAKARELPARLSREIQGRALAVNLGVPTAEGTVWMELDSGNGGTLLVSKPYARLLGLDPAKDGPQAADFEVAPGLRATSALAFAPNMIIDGNLGMPFLKDKALTMDLAAGRLWIATGGGARGQDAN